MSNSKPSLFSNPGFTLVELMVVLTIIAVLASVLLGALYSSQESARATQTRHTIAKLHQYTMYHWETYRTRRLDVIRLPGESYQDFARKRLVRLWQVMQAEMPDHYSDFLQYVGTPNPPSRLVEVYNLRLSGSASTVAAENQSAECFYLFITVGARSDDDLPVRSREVGDTDGDGMLEFLDGWGQPIRWLRWAPGFRIQGINLDINPSASRDPFDPLGVSNLIPAPGNPNPGRTGFMIPLIYSVGPDGAAGINNPEDVSWSQVSGDWHPLTKYSGQLRGTILDSEAAGDNIHNLLLQVRTP